MLTRIQIERFKSLRKVDLHLAPLNVFIGTNASGKSNLLDALRFVQGVGYGLTVDEIFNGKPKTASNEVWEPIRGGSAKAEFVDSSASPNHENGGTVKFGIELRPKSKPDWVINYSIGVSPKDGCVRSEQLSRNKPIFDSADLQNPLGEPTFQVRYYVGKQGQPPCLAFQKSRPVLIQMLGHPRCSREHREVIQVCLEEMSNVQRIDPSPALLRNYSQAVTVRRMGERGENFAALVNTIVSDLETKAAYLDWLKMMTPVEVEDVGVLNGALGEPLVFLREKGHEYPAPVLSDGTLRFAAIAAAFFQPDMPRIITLEEIENGIHPTRLRMLVELLKSQSREERQVIATTHSPVVLAWLKPDDYGSTFFCKRKDDTGESEIRPLSEVPRFLELVKRQPIGDLFAEGWLEGAL